MASAPIQSYLITKFTSWTPTRPRVVSKTKHDITMCWLQEDRPFGFLTQEFLYRIYKESKIPAWKIAYSGGKSLKTITDLAPSFPHKFRLQVILKAEAVNTLTEKCLAFYGNEENIYRAFGDEPPVDNGSSESDDDKINKEKDDKLCTENGSSDGRENMKVVNCDEEKETLKSLVVKLANDGGGDYYVNKSVAKKSKDIKPWLESQWSTETCATTDTAGTTAACFHMAVRCGYLKQVQQMLEEKPELLEIINPSNGQTPLITAVRKGDTATISFLLSMGAEVEARSSAQHAALHVAVCAAQQDIAALLLDKAASLHSCDINGLNAVHCAVDSGSVQMLRLILDRGGQLEARDSNGWTPLFRASKLCQHCELNARVCQGAPTSVVEELVSRGANCNVKDNAGLPLPNAARLLRKRNQPRNSVIRLVDARYPHEMALSHFTRLTKKISSVQSLFR